MRIVLLTALTLTLSIASNAATLFDNGGYSGQQSLRLNSGRWTMYDDFTIGATSTVTGVEWGQHDNNGDYISTVLEIYAGSLDSNALIFSTTLAANRTLNGTPALAGGTFKGYDYSVSGLNLVLGPGSYFLSLHNNGTLQSAWDETEGNSSTIAGRYQRRSGSAAAFFVNEDSVFRVIGDTEAVPEPSSFALMALGGLAVFGRRRLLTRG